ncbi:MAG: hypothetical protein WCP01_01785 [Methylococcaceae bacterium]
MFDDDLIRLKTLLAAGVVIPPDLAGWIIDGIDLYYNGNCKSLCRALNLRRTGQSSYLTRELLKRRNDCLNNIGRIYGGSAWEQSGIINAQLKKYPRIDDPEQKALYGYLLKIGVKIPGRDGIFKILQSR